MNAKLIPNWIELNCLLSAVLSDVTPLSLHILFWRSWMENVSRIDTSIYSVIKQWWSANWLIKWDELQFRHVWPRYIGLPVFEHIRKLCNDRSIFFYLLEKYVLLSLFRDIASAKKMHYDRIEQSGRKRSKRSIITLWYVRLSVEPKRKQEEHFKLKPAIRAKRSRSNVRRVVNKSRTINNIDKS